MFLLALLIRWVVLAAATALAAWLMPGVSLEGGALAAMWVALLISLANVLVQPLMWLLPQLNSLVVLAILTMLVNGLAVWIASAFTKYLDVDGFLAAVGVALLISVFSFVLTVIAIRLIPDTRTGSGAHVS